MRKLGDECGTYLAELSREDERIWVLDGDLADSDGAESFSQLNPGSFIQAGISEQSMVTAAAGMATAGQRPWVFSFAAFLCCRAYDQIRTSISQTRLPVTLVGSHAGGLGGRNGKSHIILNDIALLSTLPHMAVWSPADAADVRFCVDAVLRDDHPAYLRLPRIPLPPLSDGPAEVKWIGQSDKTVLVTHGLSTHWACAVKEKLLERGVGIGVLQILKVWPLPERAVEILTAAERIFVLEDHSVWGGLGSLLDFYKVRVDLRLGWPIHWAGQSGSDEALRQAANLDTLQIVEQLLEFGTHPSS